MTKTLPDPQTYTENEEERLSSFFDFARGLPDDNESRDFERRIERFVSSYATPPLQVSLAKMLEDPSRGRDKERIAAFAVVGVHYRRLKQATKLNCHLTDHEEEFGNTAPFKHLKLNYFSMTVPQQRNAEEVYRYGHALCESSRKQANLKPNPGILHAFALAIVEILEGNTTLLDPDESSEWLSEAKECIQEALSLESHASFYCTHARLLVLEKEYDKAIAQLYCAIDHEDTDACEYQMRVSSHLARIQNARSMKQFDKKLGETETKLKEALGRETEKNLEKLAKSLRSNIELITLLAGIMGFIVGGLNIAVGNIGRSTGEAAILLLVYGGILVVSLSLFGTIMDPRELKSKWAYFLAVAVGAISIVASLGLFVFAGGKLQ